MVGVGREGRILRFVRFCRLEERRVWVGFGWYSFGEDFVFLWFFKVIGSSWWL